jgi:hypothetical protein
MKESRVGLITAVLLLVSMWCYADLILVPYQVAEAARSARPRGNLSDLYPRWLGARELLLHGRDPYSPEITREIQAGYYGRPLDSSRPNDPKDQQGFAYPVYVAFFLAPTVKLPFATVQGVFRWILLLLIAAAIPLWLWALQWHVSGAATLSGIVLLLGTFPAVQAIKLQQLTTFVCFLLAACAAALSRRRLVTAGILLGMATIKPQLAIPFAAWLAVWTLGDWRSRQRLIWSFAATLTVLVTGGEVLLPGWIGRFRNAAAAYLHYAGGRSLLDLALTPRWGRPASVLLIIVAAFVSWRGRRAAVDSEVFRWTLAMVLAVILAVIPTFAPYNQLLLVPALLLLVRRAPLLWKGKFPQRVSLALVLITLALPWLATVGLDVTLLFLPQSTVERGWSLPLWSSWAIPFSVLAALGSYAAQVIREPITPLAGLSVKTDR